MSNLQVQQNAVIDYTNIYRDLNSFEGACRMASTLSKSSMIPKDYQGNPSNTLIALEMSQRLKTSPLMVMQSLFVINGRPSWSSQFIIANINNCGRFKESLQFEMSGADDERSCFAWTIDLQGKKLVGPTVSIQMAKDEGWYSKSGSKWKTMPEIMLRYRAASFFGKMHCPELLLGISTREEVIDIVDYEIIEDAQMAVDNEIKENANKETVRFDDVPADESGQEENKPAEKQEDAKESEQEKMTVLVDEGDGQVEIVGMDF